MRILTRWPALRPAAGGDQDSGSASADLRLSPGKTPVTDRVRGAPEFGEAVGDSRPEWNCRNKMCSTKLWDDYGSSQIGPGVCGRTRPAGEAGSGVRLSGRYHPCHNRSVLRLLAFPVVSPCWIVRATRDVERGTVAIPDPVRPHHIGPGARRCFTGPRLPAEGETILSGAGAMSALGNMDTQDGQDQHEAAAQEADRLDDRVRV